MTYHMFVTTLLMIFFGDIPHGLDTGRRRNGSSQFIGHHALAIGYYALLIFLAGNYSSLTASLNVNLGRRTFRYM
jgi:hypothetical protein